MKVVIFGATGGIGKWAMKHALDEGHGNMEGSCGRLVGAGLVLGIIPAVICLISGSLFLLVWSIIFIVAAGGDIWMAWLLTKESPDCTVLDYPSEGGFYVFD